MARFPGFACSIVCARAGVPVGGTCGKFLEGGDCNLRACRSGGVEQYARLEVLEGGCDRGSPQGVERDGAVQLAGGNLPEVRLAPLAFVREQFLRAEPERCPVEIEQQFFAVRRNVARGIEPHF